MNLQLKPTYKPCPKCGKEVYGKYHSDRQEVEYGHTAYVFNYTGQRIRHSLTFTIPTNQRGPIDSRRNAYLMEHCPGSMTPDQLALMGYFRSRP